MTERLYVRQINDNHWQWRLQFASGEWDDDVYAGTVALLAEALPNPNIPLCLLVPGHMAVVRNESVDLVDKKHLAKLLPYEMEEDLIAPVEDLHFCLGNVEDDRVNVIYVDAQKMQASLDALAPTGCEVQQVYPDYLLLGQEGYAGIIVVDDDKVLVKFSESKGFSVELNMLPLVLRDYKDQISLENSALRLVAGDDHELSTLRDCLPHEWLEMEELEIHQRIASYWDCLDSAALRPSLNMRSGMFARKLPINQWWSYWKTPGYFVAAAFILAFMVNLGYYFTAKSESQDIRKQMQAIYMQAVPNGRPGDEENRLKSLLKADSGGGSNQPTNLMYLLSGLAKAMASQKDIQLSNFRYNGEQLALQINIEVKGLGELGQFREQLTANGLVSDSPRTSSQGDIYQANMKITEASNGGS